MMTIMTVSTATLAAASSGGVRGQPGAREDGGDRNPRLGVGDAQERPPAMAPGGPARPAWSASGGAVAMW